MVAAVPSGGHKSSRSPCILLKRSLNTVMDSRYYISCAVLVSGLAMAWGAATESPTTLPPNFVPMIDGGGSRPADLPEILAAPDAKGQVCTLASLEATVVIWPDGDESREVRIEMPGEGVTASSTQTCNAKTATKPLLVVTWSTFQLCFFISKSEKNWTLDQVSFVFNTSDVPLGLSKSETAIFASGPSALNELQAPLGYSYRCYASKQYALSPIGGASASLNTNATLLLKSFQLQPFVDDSRIFGEEVVCQKDLREKRRRRHLDATVTIAVGSSLAVVSVITVIGYALWRHIKIKAVGYDTMN